MNKNESQSNSYLMASPTLALAVMAFVCASASLLNREPVHVFLLWVLFSILTTTSFIVHLFILRKRKQRSDV